MTAMASFMGRNSPLQWLFLRDIVSMNSTGFISLLGRLRNLQALALVFCGVDDSILEALMLDPSSSLGSWMCPQLLTLDVTGSKLSLDLFAGLVGSRAPTIVDSSTVSRAYLRHVYARFLAGTESGSHVTALEEIAQGYGGRLEIEYEGL
jgi:hypothetical protein